MNLIMPDGDYPFVDQRMPLSELQMIEAPQALEALLRQVAADNGTEIAAGKPVELRCEFQGVPEATFLAWQPAGGGRLHMLAPTRLTSGRA